MNMLTHDMAKIADRAGLNPFESCLLISTLHNLNDTFQKHMNDVMVINRLADLDQFKDARFDKIIIMASGISMDSVLQYLDKLSYMAASGLEHGPVIYVHGIKDANPKRDDRRLRKMSEGNARKSPKNNNTEFYKWRFFSLFKEPWEDNYNLLVMPS